MAAANMDRLPIVNAERIRRLNDAFRHTFVGGVVTITSGIEQLDPPTRSELLRQVREFTRFDWGNDPHAEHDFGALEFGDQRILWKIDYYDRQLEQGSDDPTDPSRTTRVLTIMLASEY
jgi:hypothetical protein